MIPAGVEVVGSTSGAIIQINKGSIWPCVVSRLYRGLLSESGSF